MFLVANYFKVPFTLGPQGFIYNSTGDYIFINSYSVFFMILVVALGLAYILIKSLAFHETHIAPHVTAKLFSLRLSSFIQSSYDLYSQGSIWLSYLYLLMFSSGVLCLFKLIYPAVFWIAFGTTLISTLVLIFDVENELAVRATKPATQEEVIINFGETDE